MNQLNITNDIVPVGEFKGKLSKILNNVRTTGRPIVITQNGKAAGVLIAPQEYDKLMYQRALISSINRGLRDVEKRDVLTTAELRAELERRRS